MCTFNRQKGWSDTFTPEIIEIVAKINGTSPENVDVASFQEDVKRATDMFIFGVNGIRVGSRVRKAKYFEQYGGEFTIRYSTPAGTPTEYQKLMGGFPDAMIYAFSDEAEQNVAAWIYCDCNVLRQHFIDNPPEKGAILYNPHGGNKFVAVGWRSIPNLVVASHGHAIYRPATKED
jgi:hypothetical protein